MTLAQSWMWSDIIWVWAQRQKNKKIKEKRCGKKLCKWSPSRNCNVKCNFELALKVPRVSISFLSQMGVLFIILYCFPSFSLITIDPRTRTKSTSIDSQIPISHSAWKVFFHYNIFPELPNLLFLIFTKKVINSISSMKYLSFTIQSNHVIIQENFPISYSLAHYRFIKNALLTSLINFD